MRRKRDQSSLPTQVELFQGNEVLQQEWERVKRKEALDVLDKTRYELKGPEDENDVEGWRKAVDNSKGQLEAQTARYNTQIILSFDYYFDLRWRGEQHV